MPAARKPTSSMPLVLAGLAVLLLGGAAAFFLLGDDGPAVEPATPVSPSGEAAVEGLPVFQQPAEPERESRPIEMRPVAPAPAAEPVMVVAAGEPTGCLQGIVVDSTRQPVEGVALSVFKGNPLLGSASFPGTRRIVESTATSGQDGRFELCGVPAGNAYIVVGEHDDFARSEVGGLRVQKDQVTTDVVLIMSPGAVVMGDVVAQGGGPIPGARVELYYQLENALLKPEDQRPHKVVFTDGAGRFAFAHVSSSSIRVRVQADGYETQSRSVSQALDPEPRDATMHFELGQGNRLPGRVVTDRGAPVAKARIEATSLTKDVQGSAVAISDEGGNFLLEGLNLGPYQLLATCPGHSDARVQRVSVSAGFIQVEMRRRGAARGVVVAAGGESIPSFTLHLMRHAAAREPNYLGDRRPFAAPDGGFLFDDLDPGDYVLEARADDWADARSEPFTIASGEDPPVRVDIVMTRGASLCGRVVDAAGQPAAGALVSLNPNNHVEMAISAIFRSIAPSDEREFRVKAGADGAYCFERIPPGTWQVAADHDGSAPLAVNDVVLADDSLGGNPPLELRLPPGAVISGAAFNSGGRALAFCKVNISQKDTGFMEAGTTDKDGLFEFRNLRSGTYQVSVTPARGDDDKPLHPFLQLVHAQKSTQQVFVNEGQVLTGVRITLPPTQ